MSSGFRASLKSNGSAAPEAMPFVQLEFAHAVGVPPGIYAVMARDARPLELDGDGPLRQGQADTLLSEIVQAGAAPSPPLVRRRRAARQAEPAAPADSRDMPEPVSLAVLTLVLASEPFPDLQDARATLAAWRTDLDQQALLFEQALGVVNLASRAYRAAATDPYVTDVMQLDPRSVRIGYGAPGALGAGAWIEAFTLPTDAATPDDGPSVEQLRVVEVIASALAGRVTILQAEDLAVRALLDLSHDRPLAAVAQVRAALSVMREELDALGASILLARLPDAPPGPAGVEEVAREVLQIAAAHRQFQLHGPALASLHDGGRA